MNSDLYWPVLERPYKRCHVIHNWWTDRMSSPNPVDELSESDDQFYSKNGYEQKLPEHVDEKMEMEKKNPARHPLQM